MTVDLWIWAHRHFPRKGVNCKSLSSCLRRLALAYTIYRFGEPPYDYINGETRANGWLCVIVVCVAFEGKRWLFWLCIIVAQNRIDGRESKNPFYMAGISVTDL